MSHSDAHEDMEDLDFGDLGGPDGDPVRGLLGALQEELVTPPDHAVRAAHLAAMTSTVPAAAGWALRFRRARIRQALVAAGLKVALVSTAAAAGTGALAVPGDVLPPSIQRAVSAAVSPLGIELPSPDDEDDLLPLDLDEELEEELEGDELPEVETPDPGDQAVLDEEDEDDEDEDEDTGDGPDPDSEPDSEPDSGPDDETSQDEPTEAPAQGGTGTTGERDDDEASSPDEADDEPDDDSVDEDAAEASTDD